MRSVLVVVTRQIGDVLLTTPLVHEARKLWPGAAIDVLGFDGTLGMLSGNPDVRQLLGIPHGESLLDKLKLIRRLWRRYDLALVADPGDRAHLLGLVAAPRRTGILPAQSSSNWWKRLVLSHAVRAAGDLGGQHVITEKLGLLAPWQPPGQDFDTRLVAPLGEPLPLALRERLAHGYVVMHTPSMFPYKQWPLAHFRELAARLAAAGRQVVLTGGPADNDRACVAGMEGAAADDLLVDAGLLNFNQLTTLLQGAALYVGPDTSVSHLAAACGTQVLVIFGPTNPQRWAPWPSRSTQVVKFERRAPSQSVGRVTILQSSLPCVPCGKAGCEDRRQSRADCLPDIKPERVAQAALALLAR
ncbi:MAG: glycosyltransferase family 9 protein [Burkholderiales bacterium]|nr:glycosyltransferase family 9 protein [Burkholderiales bacterium]